ncbi:MAG: type I-E CRISPR-associated protein Cas5/CasD [Candidatus Omnitrophica bacterium]|nr:type I-E CRISPR-associated protein Cas5/CasD [Candidatus Omnitrophota bacterium]MBU4479218.1 type I-E CRISPR-associated protein Cas5/CasD [Candidatus Omnitrophota bacterium]
MKYLLFRLYGPMSSWGDIAVGETRPSFTHPTKSAVLGLVAGAMGIRRDEEEKHKFLAEGIGFAVQVEFMGYPLSDYHTAQVPSGKERYCTRRQELSGEKSELNTILSTRDYRADGLYIIVLWQRKQGEWSQEQIKEKLEQPEFVPYLGRKSCPAALPFEAQVVDAVSLVEALAKGKFSDIQLLGFKPVEQKMLYWDEDAVAGIEQQHVFERRDLPLSRGRWQFDTRKERHAVLI